MFRDNRLEFRKLQDVYRTALDHAVRLDAQKRAYATAKGRPSSGVPMRFAANSGHFHADEALAVYLLRLLPAYSHSDLLRTRDPSLLATCHTVVDVGGTYAPPENRYDHHQRDFSTTFPARQTKLSSAGLVYMHFGKEIIAQHTGLPVASPETQLLYQGIYEDFIEAFDANDNGISAYDSKPKFNVRGFTLASVVSRFNSHWDNDDGKSAEQLQREEDERFLQASRFTGEQFIMELTEKARAWLPARSVVRDAFTSRKQWDARGRILVLPWRKEGLPWAQHLYSLERELGVSDDEKVLYVLFAESGDENSKWRIRAVGVEGESFEIRRDLPSAWKGLRDEELDEVSGIPGCVFVHASGFIGGNKNFGGALTMAKQSLEIR